MQVRATFHHFAQEEPLPGQSHRTLGQELDLAATYQFAESVTFGVGLSGFRPGEAMELRQGTDEPAYWGYLTSVINF